MNPNGNGESAFFKTQDGGRPLYKIKKTIFQYLLLKLSLLRQRQTPARVSMVTQWVQPRSSIKDSFYARDAMQARVLAVIVCPSVRLSEAGTVLKRLNVRSRKQRHVIAQRHQFSVDYSRWWATPCPLKFMLKVTHTLSNTTISTNIRSQCLNRESQRKMFNQH